MTDPKAEFSEAAEAYVAPMFPRKYEDLRKACETLMLYEVRDYVAEAYEAGAHAALQSRLVRGLEEAVSSMVKRHDEALERNPIASPIARGMTAGVYHVLSEALERFRRVVGEGE
jgi:hypothetical protein